MMKPRRRSQRLLLTLCSAGALSAGAHAAQLPDPPSASAQACYAELDKDPANLQVCEQASRALTADSSMEGVTVRARVLSALAMLQLDQGERAAARASMNQALSLAAGDDIVQGNHASLLLREGAYRDALQTYNQVLVRLQQETADSPLLAPLYLNRSLALRALGDYAEASKDYALYLVLTGRAALPQSDTPNAITPQSTHNQSR